MKGSLDAELDKKKIYVIRYALPIVIILITFILLLLNFLKIDHKSILEIVVRYYIR